MHLHWEVYFNHRMHSFALNLYLCCLFKSLNKTDIQFDLLNVHASFARGILAVFCLFDCIAKMVGHSSIN